MHRLNPLYYLRFAVNLWRFKPAKDSPFDRWADTVRIASAIARISRKRCREIVETAPDTEPNAPHHYGF